MRRIAAAAIAAAAVFTAVGASAATSSADAQCTGQDGPNPAAPEAYKALYDNYFANDITEGLKAFHTATASGDTERIGMAAGQLYNQISTAPVMYGTQSPFGCYDPALLAGLQQAGNTLATALDRIGGAAAGVDGRAPTDVPALVSRAKPQETAYINALNAYSAQFGGQPLPTS